MADRKAGTGHGALQRRLAVCALLFAIAPTGFAPAQAAGSDSAFRQGLSAYNSGDFAKAMKIWLPLAEKEDAASQAGIGFMFHRGM